MTRDEIIEEFLLDYAWRPTDEEYLHFKRFCDTTARDDVLAQVLNPMNHHKREDIMRPQPPKVAALYAIRYNIVKELNRLAGIDEQALQRATEKDGEEEFFEQTCNYCLEGVVFDFVYDEDARFWNVQELGPCAKCSDGAWLPRDETIAAAKAVKAPVRAILFPIFISLLAQRMSENSGPQNADMPKALKIAINNLKRKKRDAKTRSTAYRN